MEKQNDLKKIEWFDDRFYKYIEKNGNIRYMPSVTTVLSIINKPFLASWRGSVGNIEADRISEIAKTKGSKIHDACEKISKNEVLNYTDYSQEEWMQIIRWHQWLNEVNPKIIETEKTIYSTLHGYAGTLDLIVWIDEGSYNVSGSDKIKIPRGCYIIDFKTGQNLSDDYSMQLASYYKAVLEMNETQEGYFADGIILVHLNAKNKLGIKTIVTADKEIINADFNNFLNCLNLFNRKALKIEPKLIEMPETLKWNYKEPEQVHSYLWIEPKEADEVRKKTKVKKTKPTKPKTKKIKEIAI